ncbi:MAG: patatin-like phospholipase family protein [Candidatus Accumulibacter sp.]|uniref:patatin-like phospholipase family protein n=1 Tax=Accumulibacter sp. TaxID=2053492 RepID=UPI001B0A18C2|nr:patatin-like phospholipase family protein [Accumulibacter sp.]MBO3701263.1 patatin-like phospholipase family protein [Accumulibacter sp.]
MEAKSGTKPFRILSLDGGGTFALIQARALDDLFPGENGHQVLSHFDLVSACSGGSIVAAALIEGYSPREIFALFDNPANRHALFGRLPWYRSLLQLLTGVFSPTSAVGHRFSTDGKLAFLHRILPQMGTTSLHNLHGVLNDSIAALRKQREEPGRPTSFLFVTYDFDRDRARMMRSDVTSPAASFPHRQQRATLAQAAHASSTAPINWFDKPAEFDGSRFWDGAMTGYNNPVLAGVVEAIAMGVPRHDIGVLSLGTSTVFLPECGSEGIPDALCRPRASTGFLPELVKVGKTIIADPPDAHTFIAHLMLDGGLPADVSCCPYTDTAIVRMNPVIQPIIDRTTGLWSAPAGWSVDDFRRIADMDISARRQEDVDLIKRLCDGGLRDDWHNQPVRGCGIWAEPSSDSPGLPNTDRLCEVGHRWYSDAKSAWTALSA